MRNFPALSSSLSMIQLLWRNPIIIIIIINKLHSAVCCVKPIHWEDTEVIGGHGAKSRRAIGRKLNAPNSLENCIFKNVSANISGSQWFRGTLHTDASTAQPYVIAGRTSAKGKRLLVAFLFFKTKSMTSYCRNSRDASISPKRTKGDGTEEKE